MHPKKGQYSDGHERPDVVAYRQGQFLPAWWKLRARMDSWSRENLPEFGPNLPGKRVVVWFHDETIFYAHDRRQKSWYHKDAPAKPYSKGEGVSLMIADFVSSRYGWLRSPDGTRSARVVMSPWIGKDGYFTNVEIWQQATDAMDILNEFYPDEEHVFVYDNATAHLQRPEGSLSATKMPKGPSDSFFVEVPLRDAQEFNGNLQTLYFPGGHPQAGRFKGMETILQERGVDTTNKKAQCGKNFNCPTPALDYCLRRILYNQPDFENVKSLLEIDCKESGFQVLFLPKFHCELNFIEQCWGYAKHIYRLNAESSRADVLEANALAALDAVPLSLNQYFSKETVLC
ncbi:hypothetical protein MVEN_00012800 [Mycena venus]|uniref:Tc1-like transposase DDE domain-containing protein n=1 Tax=Mycena venus TaxID=2733690 RepID=A0A8H7DDL3_9AGAR|nr:hypothetical protein MVEN_00012800 [Mycena venus]